MEITFIPVNEENEKEIRGLRPALEQQGFIETVDECLREAGERADWRPLGIYADGRLVGFAMYGFFQEYPPAGRLWLDRLLIDERCQGKGYGRRAFAGLLRRLWKEYPWAESIYLSVTEGNTAAAALYESFGFSYTGERDVHNERVMLLSGRPETME